MCTSNYYKETVFFFGLILNIISSIIILILIILSGVQYKFININWAKINAYQNLGDYELSLCIIYIFCCILGFIVFIKKLECKTMQKIYLLYGILSWIYSIIVCVIAFIYSPNVIKDNDNNSTCKSINLKGLLKDFNNFDNLFYEINKYLCSSNCPCANDEKMNFQKCDYNDNLTNYIDKQYENNFDEEKLFSYWARIENKFDCAGICKTKYLESPNGNNEMNISQFLFTDITKDVKNYGCIYPLSNWLNKMIISFGSLLIINIFISTLCLYICFAILFDKVYEGSNLPKSYISKNKLSGIIPGGKDNNSLNVKIINNNNTNNDKGK